MDLKIFDVEHGACALLTCDDGTRLMLDAGHNGSTGWRPGDYLRQSGIHNLEMLAITNYDEDHVSGIENLFDHVHVEWLSRNPTVSTTTLRSLKSDAGMGSGIDRLCRAIDGTFTGGSTESSPLPAFLGLNRQEFYCSYPEFDDENNLSYVNFLNCNGIGVLFAGDLERAGWDKLSQNAQFRNAMRNTNVLIAPHHGRVSDNDWDYFVQFYKTYLQNVFYVVISDKGYMHNTQETLPLFRSFSQGGPFRGQNRQVLTTRNDGRIGFTFEQSGWSTY